MTEALATKSEAKLDPNYFRGPVFWRFNTPDFYVFYAILGALIAISLLFFLVILLSQNKPSVPPPIETTQRTVQSALPTTQPSGVPSASETPTSLPSNSAQTGTSTQQQFESAEQQPSYSLRAEAYAKLRKEPGLSYTDRLKATAAYQRNHGLALQAQRQLDQALYGIDHEHFSQSIRQLKNLIAGGEILGDAFLKAQQALPKAYLKKIDYFLIQGQITQAHKALNEAKKAQVPNEDLAAYEAKIKSLEKVSR